MHIGHIFSYTQAEMIARFRRMQGKNVFYPFGFDDNGLPTERLVEKEEGIQAKDLPRSEFIEKCLKTTCKYEEEFRALWKSLGFGVDWSLQYETIGPLAQKISQRSFLDLVKKGKAYLKETPVLWCTTCRTSIAQAELDSTEKETTFNRIPFLVEGEELIVATTRPELLYGCTALFVHPEDDRYRYYIGKQASVPLYDYLIPVLGDGKVSMDKGIGVVMCATFGDTTDLEWYHTYNLPYRKVIESDGAIAMDIPDISGLKVKDARVKIIHILKERGILRKSDEIIHTAATHERCGKEIKIIPSRQWYIDILTEKEKFLQAGSEINWYPPAMKIRYETWVRNLKWDWCISRQRYFGVPIPIWYCSDCGTAILAHEEDLPVNPRETNPNARCKCGGQSFIPEETMLDTWATSSVTPLINAKWREADDRSKKLLPMGMRTQAHEIIRTWAFYTIVKSLYHTGGIPWKDIMICGFVMAKKGEKISKSRNNAASSSGALIERYSADALRYWAANARLGTDTMFSEEELQISNKFLTKLWNAAKFTLMHLEDYTRYNCEKIEPLMPIDRWIIERRKETKMKAAAGLDQYEAGTARQVSIHMHQWGNAGFEANAITAADTGSEAHGAILQFGERVKKILTEVRRYKSERNLSLKTPVNSLEICVASREICWFEETKKDLAACTGANEICFKEGERFTINTCV